MAAVDYASSRSHAWIMATAAELKRQMRSLMYGEGLVDASLVVRATEFVQAVTELAAAGEVLAETMARLVKELPPWVSTAERDRRLMLLSLNTAGEVGRNRRQRVEDDRELKLLEGRSIARLLAESVDSFVRHYFLPAAGRDPFRTSQLERLAVTISLPHAGSYPTTILERRQVAPPVNATMSEWRASRDFVGRPVPVYQYVGPGLFQELPTLNPCESSLRVKFDPPTDKSETLSLQISYPVDVSIPSEDYGHYRYTFDGEVEEFVVTAHFGSEPSAVYWLDCSRSADWPARPNKVLSVPVTHGLDGTWRAEYSTIPPVHRLVGLAWFWVPVNITKEGELIWT